VRRRFITKAEIDALADRGETTFAYGRDVTITDLAREHARARGVRLVSTDDGEARPARPAAPVSAAEDADEVRAAVRSAVIGRLGEVPAGLDAIIDRVLAARGSG
jgi:hypothetical protein